jgi:hypothetical protein
MTYGHAERNLALLRQLEAEARQLLESLDQPDPEQSAWLQEAGCAGLASSLECRTTGPSHKEPDFRTASGFLPANGRVPAGVALLGIGPYPKGNKAADTTPPGWKA